jgi:hypothetical protein
MRTMKNTKRPKGIHKPTITLVTDPFEVEAKLIHDDACGGWKKSFRAAIEVQCSDLDEHGFVVEALTLIQTVRDFFATATYKASCEQLAGCVINLVTKLVGDKLTHVQVKVFSLTGHIRMEWREGDVVPELPFCVTNGVQH